MSKEPSAGARPAFRQALAYWAQLGWINFGGPAGQIALLHRDVVERRGWISEPRFLHALSFCMLLPGPEAQQLATYVGWLLHGLRGALAAGILFVLPSVAILWALAAAYALWGALPLVAGAFAGVQPVVVALVAEAVVRLGRRAFVHPLHVAFAALAFAAIALGGVPFPALVAAAAAFGALAGRHLPRFAPEPEARVDPETEPPHVRAARRPGRLLGVLAWGLALWALPFAALALTPLGRSAPVLGELYRFFTQAAFVTFGGAYAVLVYVAEVAVDGYRWLGQGAMIAGLGLAETTPGPLIMVLQFVGFQAGWNHPGSWPQLGAATAGALLTTWVTFLPSVLFILLGAPFVERLRGVRWLAAALAGVTAAVVGVILNLGVELGRAALVRGGAPDALAILAAAVALTALVRWRLGPGWLVLAGVAFGLARSWVGL